MATGRNLDLDSARGLLMVAGVFIHPLNPYVADRNWIVRDTGDLLWLGHIQEFLHQFRMPGFFMISGLLGLLALKKHGAMTFVIRRLHRLGWPFLAMLLTLNLLQYQFVLWYIDRYCADGEACAVRITPGLWVAHLWFLVFLMAYSVLLPALARFYHSILVERPAPALWTVAAIMFGLLLVNKALASGFPWWYQTFFGIGSGFEFIRNLVFFSAGALLASCGELRARYFALGVWQVLGLLALGIACYAVSVIVQAEGAPRAWAISGKLFLITGWVISTLGGVRVCMLLGRQIPRLAQALLDSSYSIYLFHHIVAVMLASALVFAAWSPMTKFLVVMLSAGLVSYAAHSFLVSRYGWLSFLFNGTELPRGRQPLKSVT